VNIISDLFAWMKVCLAPASGIPSQVLRKLEILSRRISVISPLLSHCLVYSQTRNSVVADSVLQTKEVLKQVHYFLVVQKQKLQDADYVLPILDEHIQELEFCTTSLNLCLTIIKISRLENEDVPAFCSPEKQCNSRLVKNVGDVIKLSPVSLVKASSLIINKHNQGGDVCEIKGTLFIYEPGNKPIPWVVKYDKALLKVYRNSQRKVYELHAENERKRSLSSLTLDTADVRSSQGKRSFRWDLSSPLGFVCTHERSIGLLPDARRSKSQRALQHNSFIWNEKFSNNVIDTFAFVISKNLKLSEDKPLKHRDTKPPESNTGSISCCSPLLFTYTARLCIFENEASGLNFSPTSYNKVKIGKSSSTSVRTPLHLNARDEDLFLILRQPVIGTLQVPDDRKYLGDIFRGDFYNSHLLVGSSDAFPNSDTILMRNNYATKINSHRERDIGPVSVRGKKIDVSVGAPGL